MRPGSWVSLLLLLSLLAGAWLAGLFPNPTAVIQGEVKDRTGPLAGARVRFQGARPLALTDSHGRFRLPRPARRAPRLAVAREGRLIRTFPTDHVPKVFVLPHLPPDAPEDYHWVEPGPQPAGVHNCVNCHQDIYREWSASAHARAAVNRRFLNLYDGSDWQGQHGVGWNLRADNPDGAAVCAACHAPTVAPGEAAFGNLRRARGVARRGVHCDFCHKIADASADERGLTFGNFGYQLLRPARGQLFFGPLDDAQRAGEAFAFAPVYRDSRYCASCHEGVVFGVPVYSTYSEWLASPACREGKQCQSCHMAPTGTLTNLAPGKGGIERDPWTLAAHRFPGGQVGMLRSCLSVSARLISNRKGVLARVEVRADAVGHRVPTGFIDRNLLLLVEAFDSAGKPLRLRAGPTLPRLAGKGFVGKPGRLYAKRLTDRNERGPIPFWRSHDRLTDTRLFPRRPDRIEFSFAKGVQRVRVQLLYRRFWKEVADVKGWPDNEVTVLDRVLSLPR